MSTDRPRAGPSLDYHLVRSTHDDHEVEGLLVEEFTRHRDFTTSGLHSAGWTPSAGWWSSAPLSRGLRTDPDVLARVVPSARADAVAAYRRLGGGHLPSEAVLRSYFRDHQAFATAPPLRLGPTQPPEGFHERRVYRVLFAKDLRADQVAALRAIWRTTDGGTAGSAAGGHHERGGHQFSWDLRRVGHTLAWGLDLTALLGAGSAEALGSILYELTEVLRQHGLVLVTTERFS
ncbi:hypothetical protein [Micromonospora sp. NBC_00617]|uniref:hypothetical protein n=1 Tax=Micromonospora sp. NBC_00617 TaxID=2903587 RepID=UPI0030E56060